MHYHTCIRIATGLNLMMSKYGRKELAILYDESPEYMAKEFIKAKNKGYSYYTGCVRVDFAGRCIGHKTI